MRTPLNAHVMFPSPHLGRSQERSNLRPACAFEELGCSRLWDALARVTSDEQLADRVVVRSVMAEETEQVDEKGSLGVASFHAVGAGESDFAALEILADLGGHSELPVGNGAFPVEDA